MARWNGGVLVQRSTDDHLALYVDAVDLKDSLCDIETDCRNRLRLLRIVGALAAPTSMALTCPWRSRPQHHKRTHAPHQ
jgi:hypothetical protein